MDSELLLREVTGFAKGLNVACKRMKESRLTPKLCPGHQRMEWLFPEMGMMLEVQAGG